MDRHKLNGDSPEIKVEDVADGVPLETAEIPPPVSPFRVDVSLIPQAESKDAGVLQDLGLQVFNQEDLEAGVVEQAERRMEAEAAQRAKTSNGIKLMLRIKKPDVASATLISSQQSGIPKHGQQEPSTSGQNGHLSAFQRYLDDQEQRIKAKKLAMTIHPASKSNGVSTLNGNKRPASPTGALRKRRKLTREMLDDEEEEGELSAKDNDVDSDGSELCSEKGSGSGKRLLKQVDDANNSAYLERIRIYRESELLRRQEMAVAGEVESHDYAELTEGLKIPSRIWGELYQYQKRGVKWLWELHQQEVGGILGDEMGLGKTIQMVAFLAGLQYSSTFDKATGFHGLGPVLIVCPATVLQQWVAEIHKWWPPARVAILHASGSHTGSKASLVEKFVKIGGILATTYQGVLSYQSLLIKQRWQYVILDEGHKIRNPDSQVTVACKQFRTPHRIILSGSPMQNNLKELWSLFDFVFPGKLGLLNVFLEQFSVPIIQGSRESASDIQVQTAYVCATALKDSISPYLLRRTKADVKTVIDLPQKNEQVLFCQLTEQQRQMYEEYLASDEMRKVMNGIVQIFVGLMQLRKLCNHPDLYHFAESTGRSNMTLPNPYNYGTEKSGNVKPTIIGGDTQSEFGYWKRSGKAIVVEALLKIWKRQEHKVLLFSQSRQMLDILEDFMQSRKYTYLRMDGTTPIGKRQSMIKTFNETPGIFVFLLTTKVGGLGVNLTGANRVIIYDPDWNPSTDTQARERAWRIGQLRDVTIYRLLCAGTIEEKIYHRQIFKQYLTNRVLKDPKQKRFFKHNDLYELFSLTPPEKTEQTETAASLDFETPNYVEPEKSKKERNKKKETDRLREMAKKINASLSKGKNCSDLVKTAVAEKERKNGHQKKDPASVDGQHVDGLVRKETFDDVAKQEEQEKKKVDRNSENYILGKLFQKTTAHSAVPFEDIANGNQKDHAIVEAEAQKVAQEAMRVLRLSRKKCQNPVTGKPIWMGHDAVPVAPVKESNGFDDDGDDDTPASALQLLSHLKRNALPSPSSSGTSGPSHRYDDSSDEETPGQLQPHPSNVGLQEINHFEEVFGEEDPDDTFASPEQLNLAEQLVEFLNNATAMPGQATTESIVAHFKAKLPEGMYESSLFRAVLRGVCDFEKKRNGPGVWTLKEPYRDYSRR